MTKFNRRDFIKITSSAGAGVALASGLGTNWWGLDKDELHQPGTEGDRIVPTFCCMCYWKCGVLAHVKDGIVTKLVGNPDHPLSNGRLCPRGVGGTGLLYDPDRLKRPLVRTKNKRGEQVFDEVSWETALGEVAEGMLRIREKHGPEALALLTHGFGGLWFKHLLKAYGSLNIGAPSYAQCRGAREVGFWLTYGRGVGSPEVTDLENAKCITLIGCHLGENMHNTQVQEFATALDRGAELIVVDPRFSTAAGKARHWLPIKPGTDIALLLAWMHVIISEKRYDVEYIDKHANGIEELKQHVADKTPEWAYAQTGIRPGLIRETARLLSAHRPASIVHPSRHVAWYGDDTQRMRAVAILTALLGSWGRRGGYLIPSSMEIPDFPYTKYAYKYEKKADNPDHRYPLADETLASGICDATLPGYAPYNLKGWFVYGTNVVQSLPDPRKTRKAIQALDLIVSIDVLPTETCGFSDVVLAESTYLERCDDIWSATYKQPFVSVRQPVVDPMYDSKPGWWIARELGHRIGLKDYFPWKDSMEYAKYRIKAAGYECDQLRETGVILGEKVPVCEEEGLDLRFDTDSGKIEIYSKPLADMGFDPLPKFTPPEEPPAGSFRLLFGRAAVHSFGRTTNNRFLSTCHEENEVWINADAAASLPGFETQPLKTGDRIILVNQDSVRSEPVRAKVTQRIRGDCVFMVHGYGHTAKKLKYAFRRGASDSELVTRYKVDPIMGGTGMNINFVRIERAEHVS